MMKCWFTAKRREIICIYLWCVLLGKLLSVHISWHRHEQTQSCGEGLCVLWPFTSLTHPYIKGLEMVWIFSKTQCPIFFFLLHSINELAVPLEVGGHCKNVLTLDLIFLWPEQSVWHVICRSGWLQWAVQCVLQIFFAQLLAGPQDTAAHSIDFHLHFQFSLHEG